MWRIPLSVYIIYLEKHAPSIKKNVLEIISWKYVNLLNCRWDLQRSREQAAYEKLKEKEKAAEVTKEENIDTVESFYPTLDDSKLR